MTWWVYALLSAVFASLTAILAKYGLANVNSNLAAAIRSIVIVLTVCVVVLFRGEVKFLSKFTPVHYFFLIASGLASAFSWLFYFKALQTGKVVLVAAIDKLSVAMTIVLAVLLLNETLTLKMVAGILFIIAGTFLLIR